jgi:hypothetical protein
MGQAQQATVQLDLAYPLALSFPKEGLAIFAPRPRVGVMAIGIF